MSAATPEQITAAIQSAEAMAANVADFGDAQRRRHLAGYKGQRQTISDNDLMFESLCDLFGFDAEERAGLHLYVARSMDKSPDDRLVVNEVDLGRQLDGDKDVTNEAFKRRTCRLFDRIDGRQRAAGRMVLNRIPGHLVMGPSKDFDTGRRFAAHEAKKVGAEYRIWLSQGIAEGVALAKSLRAGNRRGRFRRAAETMFRGELFPKCEPEPKDADAHVKAYRALEARRLKDGSASVGESAAATAEKRVSPERIPRTIRRFKDNAALALSAARERDASKGDDAGTEFNRTAAVLAVELVRVVGEHQTGGAVGTADVIRQTIELLQSILADPAELSCIEATTTTLEAKDIQDSADLGGISSEADSQNSRQKRENGPAERDSPVKKKRLPDAFINDVRRRADIVQVVSSRGVKLTRKGNNWFGPCPFHEEKTASFSVTPGKGLYHCFGCAAGGDVFKFVTQSEGVGFRDAVKIVAEAAGVPWPEVFGGEPPRPRELTFDYEQGGPPPELEVFDL